MRKTLTLLFLLAMAMAVNAQQALDFAQKFMTLCEGDSSVNCVTVSPKMMEQIAERQAGDDQRAEQLKQAIAKLKSMRIVSAPAGHYERAEQLIKKYASRFKMEKDFNNELTQGAFYTRKTRKGDTVELVMLHEDTDKDLMTVICLTGQIDEEFLCFLYNNKSLKD